MDQKSPRPAARATPLTLPHCPAASMSCCPQCQQLANGDPHNPDYVNKAWFFMYCYKVRLSSSLPQGYEGGGPRRQQCCDAAAEGGRECNCVSVAAWMAFLPAAQQLLGQVAAVRVVPVVVPVSPGGHCCCSLRRASPRPCCLCCVVAGPAVPQALQP